MNLLIVKKLNHPHTTKERKFVNQVNAVKKKRKQKLQTNIESDTSQRFHHKRSRRTK